VSERHELRPVDVEAEACIFAAYERGRAAGWRERGEAEEREGKDSIEFARGQRESEPNEQERAFWKGYTVGVSVLSSKLRALPPAPPQEDRT
jgi:hypothetical protein